MHWLPTPGPGLEGSHMLLEPPGLGKAACGAVLRRLGSQSKAPEGQQLHTEALASLPGKFASCTRNRPQPMAQGWSA